MASTKHRNPQSIYQVLSLDVVVGTIAVGLFALKILNVQPNPWWWAILTSSVWVVYTLDHLLDGWKMRGGSVIYRHQFHYEKRTPLLIAVFCIGLFAAISAFFFLDMNIIKGGIGLGFFIVIYFLTLYFSRSKNWLLQKELFIACVYIFGIILAPLVWLGHLPSPIQIFIFTAMAILAWIESILISWFDYGIDKQDGLTSFSQLTGKTLSLKFVRIILILLTVFLSIMLFRTSRDIFSMAIAIEIVMSIILLGLAIFPKVFSQHHLFRWIGEGVFILPAAIVLF